MSRDGFTLVEVMVALVVSTLAAMAAHTGLQVIRDSSERAAYARETAITAAAVRRQLTDWLAGAFLAEQPAALFSGTTDRAMGAGGSPSLKLQTRVPSAAEPGRVELLNVVLQLEGIQGRDGGVLVAEIVPLDGCVVTAAIAAAESGACLRRVHLAAGVRRWSVRYLRAEQDLHMWVPEWSSRVSLPAAVQIVLEGDSVHPLLQVPLTVPLTTGSL